MLELQQRKGGLADGALGEGTGKKVRVRHLDPPLTPQLAKMTVAQLAGCVQRDEHRDGAIASDRGQSERDCSRSPQTCSRTSG